VLVNFFGHAAIASWSSASPAVVLGAMLPDFATMSGARLAAEGHHDEIAAGIAIHHATDSMFHQAPVVTALMRDLDMLLVERGCARGPRRAVAHIGVELLLDGVLVDEASYRAAYSSAIEHDGHVAWREADHPTQFATLIARLRAHGVPDDLRDPAKITVRLGRMLGHRPLLAPSPADLHAIGDALSVFKSRVEVATEAVLRVLRAGAGAFVP
jgi:acyl carrier protein phosphodiesterase